MVVVGETSDLLDAGGGTAESLEDLSDVGTVLHGDDTELVLLVDPDEESLGVVVEDTTSLRPLALETARLEVLVTALEKEVVSDELVALGGGHGGKGVVLTLKLTSEGAQGGDNLLLDLTSLLGSNGGTERVVGEVAADVILILTASATSDPDDTAPNAVRCAGGEVLHFGMPVDPGNLLFLGRLGARPVIGLPGCARSPALNGADWVLERVACGVPVTGADITAMGVGGLLKESPARPHPRERR